MQFVCLNFKLLASNPKTSENHCNIKTCSTNLRLCTMPPSLTQGHNTAFPLSSPPAPPAAQWCPIAQTASHQAEVGHHPPPMYAVGKVTPTKHDLNTTKRAHGAAGSAA